MSTKNDSEKRYITNWFTTFYINLLRGFFAGISIVILSFLFMPDPLPFTSAIYYALTVPFWFPILYFIVFFPIGWSFQKFSQIGDESSAYSASWIQIFFSLSALLFIVPINFGDPWLFFLKKMIPNWIPIKKPSFFMFKASIQAIRDLEEEKEDLEKEFHEIEKMWPPLEDFPYEAQDLEKQEREKAKFSFFERCKQANAEWSRKLLWSFSGFLFLGLALSMFVGLTWPTLMAPMTALAGQRRWTVPQPPIHPNPQPTPQRYVPNTPPPQPRDTKRHTPFVPTQPQPITPFGVEPESVQRAKVRGQIGRGDYAKQWLVILAGRRSFEASDELSRQLIQRRIIHTILDSSEFSNLNPGWFILAVAGAKNKKEAIKSVKKHRKNGIEAYAKFSGEYEPARERLIVKKGRGLTLWKDAEQNQPTSTQVNEGDIVSLIGKRTSKRFTAKRNFRKRSLSGKKLRIKKGTTLFLLEKEEETFRVKGHRIYIPKQKQRRYLRGLGTMYYVKTNSGAVGWLAKKWLR